MAATASRPWLIFSYGSNSTKQLQRRVGNLTLTSTSAVLEGYARCFCLRSQGWGGGGVASLCPADGATTYGAVVQLTDGEKARLDMYEGGYRLEPLTVQVGRAREAQNAFAYIAGHKPSGSSLAWTQPLEAEPTEPYLCAIHAMLAEHWDMGGETITVRSFNPQNGTADALQEWSHPGPRGLQDLGSLVVEVNSRRTEPWEMPKTIPKVTSKLHAVGIDSVAALAEALAPDQRPTLNARLKAKNQRTFGSETLAILRDLLLVEGGGATAAEEHSGRSD